MNLEQGTARSYTLRRLARERPDLLEAYERGETLRAVLGKHGGDRKSEKVTDQATNGRLIHGNTTPYTLARLDRDRQTRRAGRTCRNSALGPAWKHVGRLPTSERCEELEATGEFRHSFRYEEPEASGQTVQSYRREELEATSEIPKSSRREATGQIAQSDRLLGKADRWLAEDIGCDHKTVTDRREAMEAGGEIPQVDKLLGKDGKQRDRERAGHEVR